MKVGSSTLIGGLLFTLLIVLSVISVQAQQERTAYALQSRRGNEGISVVVNVNINPHRKKRSATAFPIDDTTKSVVSSFKEALSSKEEREVAETYLEFADKIKGIADQVDQVKSPEATELKQQLLTIVKDFTLKSEHPSVDLLQSSLSDISSLNENQPLKEEPQPAQQQASAASGPVSFESSSSGAKSLWIGQAISIASLGMNIVDGIGTYSDKISKVGKFLSGPVSEKLNKWGMGGIAETAKKWGSSVDTFSQTKLKPIETKIAKKIAPVVKSKTFQAVRRTLNVVSGAISLKGGLTALGMVRNIKLPTSYKALKTSLTKATQLVKNRKQVMSTIRKTVAGTKAAGRNWKNLSTVGKLKNANEFRKAYSGLKTGLAPGKKTNNQGRSKAGRNSGKSSQGRNGSSSRSSGRSSTRSGSSRSSSSSSRSSSSRSTSKSSSGRSNRSSGSRSSSSRSSSKPPAKRKELGKI